MRLAVYAHYSQTGGLANYVLFYLRALRQLGFQICFVSNSPVPASSEGELLAICNKVIKRENSGYDFGMWQQALEEYELTEFDELLLTNSSIIGPLCPLQDLWAQSATSQCDFWGLTDNDEYGHHLQSYFMVFRKTVLKHPCFLDFWGSLQLVRDKQTIVERYEIGLTSWLEQHGLKWMALFPQHQIHALLFKRLRLVDRLKLRMRPSELPKNTTMLLPDILLECGMPFLKASLFTAGGNPLRQIDASFAMRLLEWSNIPADILREFRMEANADQR